MQSFQSLILVSSLILYSIGQVSALRCHICASTEYGECYMNPKQQYAMDCSNWNEIPQLEGSQFSGFTTALRNAISNLTGGRGSDNFECVTIQGEVSGQKSVIRSCSPKAMTCDAWKGQLQPGQNMQIQSCHSCESDLCNSSHNLSVGFLSLIGSLLLILWTRN